MSDELFCPECLRSSNKRLEDMRKLIFDAVEGMEVSVVEIVYLLDLIKFQLLAESYGIKPNKEEE